MHTWSARRCTWCSCSWVHLERSVRMMCMCCLEHLERSVCVSMVFLDEYLLHLECVRRTLLVLVVALVHCSPQ